VNRAYQTWWSPSLGRDMELLVFGHAGARILAFPTSKGRFFDWEDRGIIAALGEHIERGDIQIFAVDSVDAEAWLAPGLDAAARARRHAEYDRYLLSEVVPFTRRQNPTGVLIAAGTSFGAYHAVNFALRHPTLVTRAIGMSGPYEVTRWTDGYVDDNVYFNSPCDFIPHEHEPARLDALRRLDVILAIGRDDHARGDNERLAEILRSKGIPHALRIWDGSAHDWPWWQQMMKRYVNGAD